MDSYKEFIKFIEIIGFRYDGKSNAIIYRFGEYSIHIFYDKYILRLNGSKLTSILSFNDLFKINDLFKKEIRSYKISKIISK